MITPGSPQDAETVICATKGAGVGVGVGLGVGFGVGFGVGAGSGVGVGTAAGCTVGRGVSRGLAVGAGVGVGVGVGVAVGTGVGVAVADAVADATEPVGVARGVGDAWAIAVADGLALVTERMLAEGPGPPPGRTAAATSATAANPMSAKLASRTSRSLGRPPWAAAAAGWLTGPAPGTRVVGPAASVDAVDVAAATPATVSPA